MNALRRVIANQNTVHTAAVESAYRFRGMSYEKLGDTEKAIADYRKLLRFNPDRRDVKKRVSELEKQIDESKPKSRFSSIFRRRKMILERSGNEREERKNNDICRIGGGEMVFADSLAEYTDSVYAVVSERYGSRQHVSGNITVISRFLDKDSIKSWVARVGVSVLVDGTEVYASASSRMIRETAEELGSDYFKISSSIDVDFTHTSKCKNAEEIVKDASYTVGNVLLIGCSELAEDVVTKRDGALRDRVVAVLPPEEENIRMCRGSGISSGKYHLYDCAAAGNPAAWTHRRQKYHTYGSFGGRYRFDQKQSQSGGGGKYQGFSLRRAETARKE